MMKLSAIAAAAALAAGAAFLAPAPASALPIGAGAASVDTSNPLVTEVQVRRRGVRGPVVHRHYGYRHGYRRGGGWGRGAAVGVGAAAALGILGAAAAANAAPVCYYQRQPLYDSWGRYLGTRNVRVCE
jgi:hypothetical protein